jgi:hypothetical protein
MTEQEKHIEFTKLTKMDEMNAMLNKLTEELNHNSLRLKELSEAVKLLLPAVQTKKDMEVMN